MRCEILELGASKCADSADRHPQYRSKNTNGQFRDLACVVMGLTPAWEVLHRERVRLCLGIGFQHLHLQSAWNRLCPKCNKYG